MRFLWLTIIIPSLLYAVNSSQDFKASFTTSATELQATDYLTVTLELCFPPSYRFDRSQLQNHLVDDQAIFKLIGEDIAYHPGSVTITYTLEPWKIGRWPLSFYNITLTSPEAPTKEIYSNVVMIEVMAPRPIAADLPSPILLPLDAASNPPSKRSRNLGYNSSTPKEEILKQRQHHRQYIVISIVFALFLLLSYGIWTKGGKAFITRKIWDARHPDPQKQAMQRLYHLQQKHLPQHALYNQYYSELTDIVRQYVERQYSIKAPEKTTPEFLEEASKQQLFPAQQQLALESFLNRADLVKFAQHPSSTEECHQAWLNAQTFIHHQKDLQRSL
ncbi:MAG: hypothetical protein ACQEP8_05690 [Chlamydiota bacterium]